MILSRRLAWRLDFSDIYPYYPAMTQQMSSREHFPKVPDLDFLYLRTDRLPGGYVPHSHDYVEVVIVLSGRADHHIDEKTYELSTGDVYVIQGNTEHGFAKASNDFRIVNIMYQPSRLSFPFHLLQKMPGYQALFVLEPARRADGGFKSKLRLDAIALASLLSEIHAMEEELKRKSPGYESLLQAQLLKLVVMLSREYSKSPEGGASRLLRMGEAIAWMEENYAKPVKLPELAKRASLSERQFLRLFHKAFGCPPIERILRLRVKAAAEMLKERGASVAEAAFASGFNDSNYFARQFKRIMGSTPKDYACGSQIKAPGR